MPQPKRARSLAPYRDVEAVLSTVLAHGQWPAFVECLDDRAATRWAFRANTYRRVLREHEEDRLGLIPGTGSSPYDDLVFKVDIANARVKIEPKSDQARLIIGGEEVTPVSHEQGQ